MPSLCLPFRKYSLSSLITACIASEAYNRCFTIEDFFMPSLPCPILKCLLPPLNLSVSRAANAGGSHQCAGVPGQSAENTGCYSIQPSGTGTCCPVGSSGNLLILTAASGAPHMHVTAGLEFKLCWVSGVLGRIACATRQ